MHRTLKQPSDEPSTPTVHAVLEATVAALVSAGVSESCLKAEYILSRALKCHRLELPSRQNRELSAGQAGQISAQVERVLAGEPIQYVLGDMDFMGRSFKTDSRALIPRPETETLVENVLACKDVWSLEVPVVADVGTGTGCIVVTLALEQPRGAFLAIDASPAALELACENAATLGVAERIQFSQGDLLGGLRSGSLDLVVSNPPFVATAMCERLDRTVRDFEPRLALDGGPDGLRTISRLVSAAAHVLKSEGRLMMEIGDDQAAAVEEMLCRSFPLQFLRLRSDCAGRARVAVACRNPRR